MIAAGAFQVADFVYDQAVILTIRLESEQRLGSKEEHRKIEELEHKLERRLPAKSGIDGHEFGEGDCTIYIYGPSADHIWESIEEVMKREKFDHIEVTLQYGRPDDPSTKDRKFTV
jgi:hypothetical protein